MGTNQIFEDGDEFLDNGGQVAADVWGLIPGVGEVVEGAQAEYHGAHMWNDFKNGHYGEGLEQGAEATWHAVKAIPGVGEALKIPNYIELANDSMEWMTGGSVPLTKDIGVPTVSSDVRRAVGHYED